MKVNLFPKILHNTALQIIGKFLSVFLGIVSITLLTRSLGPVNYGYYTTILNYFLIVGVILDGGLHLTMIQLASKEKNKQEQEKIINNVLSLKLISASIILIIAVLVAFYLPYPKLVKIGISIISFSILLNSLIQILIGIFQIHLKMLKVVVADIIRMSLYLLALFFLYYFHNLTIYSVLVITVLTYLLNFLILLWEAKKYFLISFDWNKKVLKKVLLFTWPLGLSVLFNLLYLRMDVFILALTRSPEEVGFYGLAYKFLDILTMVSPMIMGIVLPILTRFWEDKDFDNFKYYFIGTFKIFVFLAFPIILGTQIIAKDLVLLFAGKEFLVSAQILQYLIFVVVALFVGGLSGYTIVALSEQKKMLWAYALIAIISLILYIIFIPKYSYWAAIAVTLFSEYSIMFIAHYIIYKKTKIHLDYLFVFKVLLASLAMYLILYFLNSSSLLLNILLGMLSYLFFVYLFRVIQKDTFKDLFVFLKS